MPKYLNVVGFKNYKIVSKIEGVRQAVDSCIINYSTTTNDFVSIPKKIRTKLGLRKNDQVRFSVNDDKKEIVFELKND
ncbi:AbrB/MazE/SpoVT family DNA-binding domain-containing protein [Flavobacterium sp. GB2R13]|uniref:AbrB/MazE/SpoVT family DNA-binding domain-containing protein n=1 Tax=Flavobacterium algoris TaxID=3398733 RepID=UPI003A884C4E